MKQAKLILLASAIAALAACGGSSGSGKTPPADNGTQPTPPPVHSGQAPTVDPDQINYNDIPVHDPSVIRTDDGIFHVVGSHLAMASSPDLITWEQTAPGIDLEDPDFAANPLFSNYDIEIAEGIDWTGGYGGSWASDITLFNDGRYYFYYNHCANPVSGVCDAPRSYLGVAVADDIMGPYKNLGIFLRSGQTADEIAEGYGVGDITSYNANIHPNTIDPHTFFDKNGKLWMVYGSYSGGIFILEMDEATGKPLPGQGYGKHLVGGNHSSIEGPYMLYSPESDYYYLFTSFGGYESTDGYNLRISRSRNPDGPFVDAEGQDMAQARGNWDSIAPYGVKLMGGFNFVSHPGDPAPEYGYLSPGHNSAYYDEETGQHFLITHTRFPNRGAAHAIRVHELFITADDWLLVAPQRYAPLEGENLVGTDDVVGDYKFVNHGKDINRQAKPSVAISLTEDGQITGAHTGTYTLYGDQPNRITLELDGLGSFEGVARWQWDAAAERVTPVFTALGSEGASIWGVQQAPLGPYDVVVAVVYALDYPETFTGTQLHLPTTGARGAQISWTSDNPDVIQVDGRVLRPNVGEADALVTLTATATFGDAEDAKSFHIAVPARQPFNRVAQFDFDGDLTDTLGNLEDGTVTGARIYDVGAGSISYGTGQNGQALVLEGSSGVRLPDNLITNYEYTVSFWINPTAHTAFTPAFFGAVDEHIPEGESVPSSDRWISFLPEGWDGNTMLWSGSETWVDATAGERIPRDTWSHMAVSVDNGRDSDFLNGIEKYSGGQVTDFFSEGEWRFALGVNYWDTPLQALIDELKVYDAALTAEEVLALDVENLPVEDLLDSAVNLLNLGDLSAVQSDIPLPTTGAYAAAIEWTSSDPSTLLVKPGRAVVTQPPASASDIDLTLTARVTLNGETRTQDFNVRVRSSGAPEPVAAFSFEADLRDSTGNFADGSPTGERLDDSGGVISFAPGVAGSALELVGHSGVRLPDDLLTDATYTISVWLKPTRHRQHASAFFGEVNLDSWISVVPLGPGDGNTMLWSGTAWYDGDAGRQIPVGTWTHFVAVNNNGELTLYLNGEETFRGSGFPDVFTSSESSRFGLGVNYWDDPYHGLIDELRIYDLPASAADIEQWYQEYAAH